MLPTVKIGPYSYKVGPNTLGIGMDNLAFSDYRIPTTEPMNYGPRYNIRASMGPLLGGHQFPLAPSGPMVDLKANGVYMAGDLALQMLTQFNKDNNLT